LPLRFTGQQQPAYTDPVYFFAFTYTDIRLIITLGVQAENALVFNGRKRRVRSGSSKWTGFTNAGRCLYTNAANDTFYDASRISNLAKFRIFTPEEEPEPEPEDTPEVPEPRI